MRERRSGSPLRRGTWVLLDQGACSLASFTLCVLAARASPPDAFGRFALVYSLHLLALGCVRALGSEPLLVRFSGRPGLGGAARAATGLALALALGLSAAVLGLALVAPPELGDLLRLLALALPGLALQDAWRTVLLAAGRPERAAGNDLARLLLQLLGFGALLRTDAASAPALLGVWGSAAAATGCLALVRARCVPDPRRGAAWLGAQRDLGLRFLGEFASIAGAGQLVVYGVGLVAGLSAVAALRAAQLVFGPVQALTTGLLAAGVAEGARVAARSPGRLRSACGRLALALGAISLVWGALALALPDAWGTALLGPSWLGARAVLPPLTLSMALAGVSLGAVVVLRARAAASRSLRARLLGSALQPLAALVGAAAGGAVGAAAGLAGANAVTSVAWWRGAAAELRLAAPRLAPRAPLLGSP